MKRWWVSWYGARDVSFTLQTPWWISGCRYIEDERFPGAPWMQWPEEQVAQ